MDDRPVATDEPATAPGPARPRRSRRAPGRRTRRRQQRRRALVARLGLTSLIVVVALAGIGWGVAGLLGDDEPDATSAPGVDPSEGDASDPQPTLLVASRDERTGGPADRVMLWSYNRATGGATVLLVPTGTVTEVPGHGLMQVGDAYALGDAPLLRVTVENLLGISIDAAAGISRQGWAALFGRVGGLTVEVGERLDAPGDDGTPQVRFRPGEQYLDGPRLAELLMFEAPGEPELAAFSRVQHVLLILLEQLAADPAAVTAVFEDGAPMIGLAGDTGPGEVETLLRQMADAHAADALVVRTLPVSPVGSGDDGSYRADRARVAELVDDRFAASRPRADGEERVRLQILNGNGVPDVDQEVAARLLPAGFEIVLNRNADRFDYRDTRILIYHDTPAQRAAARRIRELLGVGRVELSQAPQSVVDLTVVVGQDFVDLHGRPD